MKIDQLITDFCNGTKTSNHFKLVQRACSILPVAIKVLHNENMVVFLTGYPFVSSTQLLSNGKHRRKHLQMRTQTFSVNKPLQLHVIISAPLICKTNISEKNGTIANIVLSIIFFKV